MNMAVDEALLLHAIRTQRQEPVLRFFEWEKRSISIGYFQRIQVALDLARESGVAFDIVRRMTGGGIVLHGNDITFSLVVPEKLLETLLGGDAREVVESYRPVNMAVLRGIALLLGGRSGQSVTLEGKQASLRDTKFCFAEPTKYDVVMNGRKVAGGAQRRLDGYVLYQGSILLHAEPEPFLQERFSNTSMTIEGLKGERVDKDFAVECISLGFRDVFGENVIYARCDDDILKIARRLLEEKYADKEWNYSR